jgi:hypothetical protein
MSESADLGIRCPRCGCRHFWCVATRPVRGNRIRRYKRCRHCDKHVTTLEVTPSDPAARGGGAALAAPGQAAGTQPAALAALRDAAARQLAALAALRDAAARQLGELTSLEARLRRGESTGSVDPHLGLAGVVARLRAALDAALPGRGTRTGGSS